MATDQTSYFFRGQNTQFFEGLPSVEETKRQTQTKQGAEKESKEVDVKAQQEQAKQLVQLGQLFMRSPERNAPPRGTVVGSAAQAQPIIAPQFQPDPTALALLSALIGGPQRG